MCLVAQLVNHQYVRLEVAGERLPQLTFAAGTGELLDEGRRGDEGSVEAVLDGAVGECCLDFSNSIQFQYDIRSPRFPKRRREGFQHFLAGG